MGKAIVVLGMHRGGTSALAGVLHLLGIDLGSDFIAGRDDNPKGFWEHEGIVEVHEKVLAAMGSWYEDIGALPRNWWNSRELVPYQQELLALARKEFSGSPLWGFKDPRACRLLPLWGAVFSSLDVTPSYVLMMRHPLEICRSLAARNGFSVNKSLLLTLRHILEAERATRSGPRVIITFDQLLSDWNRCLRAAGEALHIQWPQRLDDVAGPVSGFLDTGLRQHLAGEMGSDTPLADRELAGWAGEVYQVLAGAASGLGRGDTDRLDRIFAQVEEASARFAGWREHHSVENMYFAQLTELNKDNERLRDANAGLRGELEAIRSTVVWRIANRTIYRYFGMPKPVATD